MSRFILALTMVLLLPVLTPSAAVAEPRVDECGGQWVPERQECTIRYQGGAIGLHVNLEGEPIGAVIVRLERTPLRGVPGEPIMECESAGFGGGCGAVQVGSKPMYPIGTVLRCVVEGRAGHGSYGCWARA
jgi:hypothetical protein